MSNPIHVALLLGLVVLYVLPTVVVARLAKQRGRSQAVYVVAALIVGWIVPLVVLLVLGRRRDDEYGDETGATRG